MTSTGYVALYMILLSTLTPKEDALSQWTYGTGAILGFMAVVGMSWREYKNGKREKDK